MEIKTRRKKKYSEEFKFKIAMEAIKSDEISELSRKYSLAPSIISEWRKLLLKHGKGVFKTTSDKENKKLRTKVARLEQMLGKKEVELNLIKNFADFYESRNTT